jgi:DNA-binding transcriptional ArsR family regulator
VQREFERECTQLFSEVVEVLGVPRSVGLIYGLLFASATPLSFSDIVERLEISKGSASQGLQLLRTLGAIKLLIPIDGRSGERTVGTSRDYYEPELALRKLVSGLLQERVAPLAVAGVDRFDRLRRLAEEGGKGDIFLLNRVKQLERWRRRFRTVFPILSTLFGPK